MRDSLMWQVNLSYNKLGPEGAKALAPALVVNASITSVDVGFNSIGKEAALELINIFKEKKMVSVGLASCNLGPEEAPAVADMIRVIASITSVTLFRNNLDKESANMLATTAKEKKISLCGIAQDQKEVDFSNQYLGAIDAILIASDLSGVRASITQVRAFL